MRICDMNRALRRGSALRSLCNGMGTRPIDSTCQRLTRSLLLQRFSFSFLTAPLNDRLHRHLNMPLVLPPLKRSGQPSARALSQRKRDLKGCLAIWVVWCCYAAYERTFDRVFGFLVPFHGEMKSVLLLFLIVTRAKGAEPLYLHVIRPFIKPYSIIVDPILEIVRDVGDFVFALLQVPMDYVRSTWPLAWPTGESDIVRGCPSPVSQMNSGELANFTYTSSTASIQTLPKAYEAVQAPRNKRSTSVRSVSDSKQRLNSRQSIYASTALSSTRGRHSKSASTVALPQYSAHLPLHEPPQYSRTLPRSKNSPLVSVHCNDLLGDSSAPGFVRSLSYHPVREYQSDEWRVYPAFPSAYPPTPLPASASLPSPVARSKSDGHYPPIPEDTLDCHAPLEQRNELKYPSSVHASSKEYGGNFVVQNRRDHVELNDESTDDASDDGSQANLSEHSHAADNSDFDHDTTMRTPYRYTYSKAVDPSPTTSSASVASQSTTLSTADNASSIQGRTSMESLYSSDSSVPVESRVHSRSRNATLRGRPGGARLSRDPLQSSASETADEDSEDSGIGVKPLPVLQPTKRASHVRPVARAGGTTRNKTAVAATTVPVRAKTVTAASGARGSGRPTSSNVSTIRATRSNGVSYHRRGGVTEFGVARPTSHSRTGTVRGKAD
ncbi:hypothetical protein EDD17DRAFT_516648 [Pisolithus thermaeus]|nr:hypothetical protein EDD17DRAFT_516648 [Pisolithus thermaeus]